ncbi:MAG: Nif3-like dinuclear metal center hexameric protein [Candidatus Hydrogenedentes bacterium]|nr:Nif3-like dinuclear metal center hexameric protein [Candidatus Hydrogenedentota bacterium]
MTVADVCAAVEELAPPGWAYEWDRSGLAVGSPAAGVSRVLVALTLTRDVLDAALRAGAEMIVCHHPPLWEPLRALRTDDAATRLLLDLARPSPADDPAQSRRFPDGIACYAAHTNLDVAPGGVNAILAGRLGLIDTAPLLPVPHATQVKLVTFVPESHLAAVHEAVCTRGAGVIGDYTHCSFSSPGVGSFLPGERTQPFSGRRRRVNEEPERRFEVLVPEARLAVVLDALRAAHPYEEVAYDLVPLANPDPALGLGVRGRLETPQPLAAFAAFVRTALKVSHLRMVRPPGQAMNRRIRTVGVLGGSGGGEIAAMPHDLDVLVTGDVRYHDAFQARDKGLTVIDAGHAGTEKWAVPAIARHIRRRCRGLRVSTYLEPDVFHLIS